MGFRYSTAPRHTAPIRSNASRGDQWRSEVVGIFPIEPLLPGRLVNGYSNRMMNGPFSVPARTPWNRSLPWPPSQRQSASHRSPTRGRTRQGVLPYTTCGDTIAPAKRLCRSRSLPPKRDGQLSGQTAIQCSLPAALPPRVGLVAGHPQAWAYGHLSTPHHSAG